MAYDCNVIIKYKVVHDNENRKVYLEKKNEDFFVYEIWHKWKWNLMISAVGLLMMTTENTKTAWRVWSTSNLPVIEQRHATYCTWCSERMHARGPLDKDKYTTIIMSNTIKHARIKRYKRSIFTWKSKMMTFQYEFIRSRCAIIAHREFFNRFPWFYISFVWTWVVWVFLSK